MAPDHTKVLLSKLNSGELQNLAVDLLEREKDWSLITHSGIVEGTEQTRSGTPDAWSKNNAGKSVYIQATGDKKRGKMLEDLKKSIEKLKSLKENEGAICVAFLNYEPQAEEISQCISLCNENSCYFEFYTNKMVSNILNKKHQDLRKKYLDIEPDQEEKITSFKSFTLIETSVGEAAVSLEQFYSVLDWPDLTEQEHDEYLSDLNSFFKTLKKLSKPSREFYCTLIELGDPKGLSDTVFEVQATEIENHLNLSVTEISKQMAVLGKFKLGDIDDGEFPVMLLAKQGPDVKWPILINLKEYSSITGISLGQIIVDLQFSLLD